MNKIKKFLTLGLTAGLFSGSMVAVAMNQGKAVKKASATSTHFEFGVLGDIAANGTSGDFTFTNTGGDKPGKVVNIDDARYWDANHYNGLEKSFIGESYGWSGKMTSPTWVQSSTGKYVYFTWTGNDQIINIYTTADEDQDKNPDLVASLTNDVPNGNSMVVNFIEIPSKYLTGSYNLYLELVDNFTNDDGYRFSSFGYLHVNAAASEVSDAIWAHINAHYRDTDEEKERFSCALDTYSNAKFKAISALSGADNADESFDDLAHFQANWYRDTAYDENVNLDHINDVISQATHHPHQRQPFNKSGTGFFKGYYEGCYLNGDFSETKETAGFGVDGFKYRFVSKPFVLSGTGFVSIKMAGHPASLHVLRGWHELAFIDNKANSRDGNNTNITTGYNALTMVRHVINLSAFKGEIIQLAFADVNTGGDYGVINIDELITKYSSNPTFKVDTVVQSDNIHHYYVDKYVPMTNSNQDAGGVDYKNDGAYNITEDTSAVQKAYTFLSTFYSTVRNSGNDRKFSWCDVKDLSALKLAYATLSEDAAAKAIVDNSEDFHYGDARGHLVDGDYWLSSINKDYKVGQTMTAINTGVYPTLSAHGLMSSNVNNTTFIIVVVSLVILTGLAVGSYTLLRRRKQD